MTIQLSYSALSDVRRCQRAYVYRRVADLRPVEKDSPATLLGSALHDLLAADSEERGRAKGSLLLDDGRTVESSAQFVRAQWDSKPETFRDDFIERYSVDLPTIASNIFNRYRDFYAEQFENESPLMVEVDWQRELDTSLDTPVTLIGITDEVYFDHKRNITVVRDHKTSKSWPSEHEYVLAMMDSQMHLYAWGLEEWLASGGYKVQAIERNMLRSVMPKIPQLTKAGALSKSITDYDAWTYRRWATDTPAPTFEGTKKDGSGAGTYEFDPEVYTRLLEDTDRFFRRSLKPINQRVIQEHLRSARRDSETVLELQHEPTEPVTTPRSLSRACQWCDYLSLCHGELHGSVGPTYDNETLSVHGLTRKVRK